MAGEDFWFPVIGASFGVIAISALSLNFLTMWCMVRGGLLTKKGSPIYIISSQNIAMETFQLLLHITYFIPSVIKQDWLFPGAEHAPVVKAFSSLFMVCWYHSTISQMFIALNRFTVVVFFSRTLFTRNRVIAFTILVYAVSIPIAVSTQYLSPCCALSFDWRFFSYAYVPQGDVYNWSNYVIDLPLNSASSITSAICYTAIIWRVYSVRKRTTTTELRSSFRKQHKEYVYAMLFCAIAAVYTFTWMFFRAFPVLIGNTSNLAAYSVIALMVLVNCSANSVIYLTNNAEIKRIFRELIGTFIPHNDIEASSTGVHIVQSNHADRLMNASRKKRQQPPVFIIRTSQ